MKKSCLVFTVLLLIIFATATAGEYLWPTAQIDMTALKAKPTTAVTARSHKLS